MVPPPIKITADEVNHIVYSYLQDSGFLHTAFTLRVEGHLEQSPHYNQHVPRGELIELLTKALLYIEVETHCKGDGLMTDCQAPFSLLKPHECAVDLMDETSGGTADKVEKPSVSNGIEASLKRKAGIPAEGDALNRRVKRSVEPESVDTNTGPSRNSPISVPDERISSERDASPMSLAPPASQSNGGHTRSRSETMKVPGRADGIPEAKSVTLLSGAESEVFVCAWNPAKPQILATGTKDSTVRIYELPDPPDDPAQFAEAPEKPPIVLRHRPDTEAKDITSLDWNPDGTLLATGSFDCVFRIWTVTGEFYMSHPQHQGPIFSARFSESGRWVLSCSLDGTACVWNVAEKKLHMQYRCHGECCLDAVWLDENIFATCGADEVIKVMRIGEQIPLLTLVGHQNEINAIRFNATKTRLASCSDDRTVKLWDIAQALARPTGTEKINLLTLEGHSDSIASLSWCPNRPEGAHEIIATAAFDGSSYIWDATTGKCLHVINDHKRAAYTLTFSPDGKFLATGSGDAWTFVYSVATGKKVWSWYAGSMEKTGIYDINWQQSGKLNRIALCLESGSVAIIDVTWIPALMEAQ